MPVEPPDIDVTALLQAMNSKMCGFGISTDISVESLRGQYDKCVALIHSSDICVEAPVIRISGR